MTKKKKSKTPAFSDHSSLMLDVFVDVLQEDFVGKDTKLVGAIDQGTSSTRFVVFTQAGRIGAISQLEHEQLYPRSGWHEHDCAVLWQNTAACITAVTRALKERQICELSRETMAAIGITNQRETTLAWNRSTGRPYHNAIVWDDTRTADIANHVPNAAEITKITGLPISSYFAGTKVKWLLDHVEQLRNDLSEKPEEVCFGTVDVWLLYQLTGQVAKSPTTGRKLKGVAGELNTGGVFKTDVSNASRWLFMDLETCSWNEEVMDTICAPHKLPRTVLPEICPSSHVFGEVSDCGLPASMIGIPLASVLGDQQAALFGQTAFAPGNAKNTYGTGLFLMMNTGTTAVRSTHGLLTTVAFQLGADGPVYYALEVRESCFHGWIVTS
jgi:glycerol kinase